MFVSAMVLIEVAKWWVAVLWHGGCERIVNIVNLGCAKMQVGLGCGSKIGHRKSKVV